MSKDRRKKREGGANVFVKKDRNARSNTHSLRTRVYKSLAWVEVVKRRGKKAGKEEKAASTSGGCWGVESVEH